MSKPIRVFMGVPSMGDRCDAQFYVLREIEKHYAGQVELVYPETCVHRMFHDYARNEVVEEFLASDCDILWFLDSDISPPVTILDLITKHGEEWELAGAPYPVFIEPKTEEGKQVVFCVYEANERGLYATNCPLEGKGLVAGLATGCMFIKRSVFSELEKPYFEFKYDPKTRNMLEGEDLGFCRKTYAKGHRFFCDFSLVCRHYKKVDLLDVANYARTFANNSINQYHEKIRPTVAALASEVERLKAERRPSGLILPK